MTTFFQRTAPPCCVPAERSHTFFHLANVPFEAINRFIHSFAKQAHEAGCFQVYCQNWCTRSSSLWVSCAMNDCMQAPCQHKLQRRRHCRDHLLVHLFLTGHTTAPLPAMASLVVLPCLPQHPPCTAPGTTTAKSQPLY